MSPPIPPAARAALRRNPWPGALLLGLVALLVFLPAVAGGFVDWDDDRYVVDNPLVLGGLTLEGLRAACTEVVFFNWAPLTILSYQLDATLFGTAPWGFHLTNVLLHAVTTALLYVALVRMTGRPGRSAAATLLFAIHPLRVESVAWIAERKDVLSVCLLMLALLAYERFCRRPSLSRYAAVFAAMLASLLAKATLVTLPVLLLLLDVWPLGRLVVPGIGPVRRADGAASPYPTRPWTAVILEKLPLVALGILFSRIALLTQADVIASDMTVSVLRSRLPRAITAAGWYVWKSVLPTGLHPACAHIEGEISWPLVGISAAVVATAVVLAITSGRRAPHWTWGIAWFLVSLLPTLGFVQVGFQAYADRFTYVPHIGLAVAAVWAAADLFERLRLPGWTGVAVLGGVCAASIVVTERQIAVWRTSSALWAHVLALDPDNPVALGKAAFRLARAGRLDDAAQLYREAINRAEYPWLIAGLARVHHARGDETQMQRHRDWAVRVAPRDPDVVTLLREFPARPSDHPAAVADARIRAMLAQGSVELHAARPGQALAAFRAAMETDPTCVPAHNLAGIACLRLGRTTEAVDFFRKAVVLDPVNFGYRVNLARALAALHDWPACLAACEEAVLLRPDDPELGTLLDKARRQAGAEAAGALPAGR